MELESGLRVGLAIPNPRFQAGIALLKHRAVKLAMAGCGERAAEHAIILQPVIGDEQKVNPGVALLHEDIPGSLERAERNWQQLGQR